MQRKKTLILVIALFLMAIAVGSVYAANKCISCNGYGSTICGNCRGSGMITVNASCARCSGTGRIICNPCKGTGWR